MPPLGVMAMAVAVDQHRFWVSALKVLPFLTSMSTATRVVPLGCRFILIPMCRCLTPIGKSEPGSIVRRAPPNSGPFLGLFPS